MIASVRGTRRLPLTEFYTGVKRNALAADELIAAILITPPSGPQQFCKIGTRNAMVIAVSAFGLALHPERKAVGTGIGSAAPTPRRAYEAESFLAQALDEAGLWETRAAMPPELAREFGIYVRSAASADRRCAGHCGLPPSRARRAGPALPDLGVDDYRRAA